MYQIAIKIYLTILVISLLHQIELIEIESKNSMRNPLQKEFLY